MDRPLSYANQINANTTRKWTVLVQVIERRNEKKNDAGTRYRNYMVTDMMGTRVPIVLFGGSVTFFGNSLMPFKRYYISNAIVNVTQPAYKVVEYDYTWTLRQRNLVEPHDETVPHALPCTFSFDRFSDLYRFADQPRSICIKALVIHALPAHDIDESSTVRDFVVINDESILMLLRVWDDLMLETDMNVYARYKVPALIVAYGLKVTTHNGLSLGTKTNAYILHNPPLNEERPLKDWYASNSAHVKGLLEARAYRDTSRLIHPPTALEIVPLITAIPSIENVKTLWTRGKLTCVPGQEKMWFEACEKCFRPVDAYVDWNIWCSNCQERTKVIVRGSINVFLSHDGTVVEATIKSPDTDKLIPFSANELRIAVEKNAPLRKEVEAAFENKEVVCFLKYYDRPSGGSIVRQYPILRAYTEAEVQSYHETEDRANNQPALEATPLATLPTIQDIGSSSTAPTTPAEKEFFTPTAKKILEEISAVNCTEQVHTENTTTTKRILSFEETQTSKETNMGAIQPVGCSDTTDQTTAPTHPFTKDPVQISPSKKMKSNHKDD